MEHPSETKGPQAKARPSLGAWAVEMLMTSGRRSIMKESTKDAIKGTAHEVKGAVKQKVGNATNNTNLEAEGQDENVTGKIQKKVGQVEKVVGR
jgi:uncharacterized protein YjbJ (UPF0337 family)